MAVASIETTLELWASSLRDVKARLRRLFTRKQVAASAGFYLDCLLGNEPRKTGWMRAEAAGDPGPWRQQAILGRSQWEADDLRDTVEDYALETLADDDAVLVLDETGFLKQGKASCGVARQYTGSVGKIANCQIGVFAAYVSRHGHAFIDRALYLPKAWTDDPARMKAAHVPDGTAFATKPALARAMIERAAAAGIPFAWVAADSVYGIGEVEAAIRLAGKGYVLGVASSYTVKSLGKGKSFTKTAAAVAQSLLPQEWRRLSAGDGVKGPRLYGWAYVELADQSRRWTRGLLIRRGLANGELGFFSTFAPAGTSIETLVRVQGARWTIEVAFETAKNELGLDHNETRSWHGWHRHVSLVMLAFAMMAAIRHRANNAQAQPKPQPEIPAARHRANNLQAPPKPQPRIPALRRLSAGPFRKSAA